MQNENRDYSIDLLRIIMMFLIVMGHCCAHTGIRESVAVFSFDWFSVWSIQTITTCAVNVFVLITGFFYERSQFSLTKVIRLWSTVSLVTVLSYFYAFLTNRIELSIGGIIGVIFPILSKQYWFFTMYFLLMFIAPFLSKLIMSISEKQHRMLVVIICVVFFVLPVFSIVFPEFDAYEGYSIIGFISLFIIGAYLKRAEYTLKKYVIFMLVVINSVVMLLSKLILVIVANKLSLDFGTGLFYHINTVFQLVQAVLLFLLLYGTKFKAPFIKKAINGISAYAFIVYLIHDNPNIRLLIWNYVKSYFVSGNALWVVLISSILVYLISLVLAIIVRPLGNVYATLLVKMVGQNRIIKAENILRIEVERTGEQ